jgi:SAM-dependent methyltransferase
MATMPPPSATGQPDNPRAWFGTDAGLALLESERPAVLRALAERPALPWLWLGPVEQVTRVDGDGLHLVASGDGWSGAAHCGLPLPLASESIGVVVLQHVAARGAAGRGLFAECARVLAPGGRLWVFALNPLAPYRWRWRGAGLGASEPLTWRRRMRDAGLAPEPVSQGLGPRWQVGVAHEPQNGPGMRAAYAIRAEKRAWPLTPVRQRARLPMPEGIPAA